MQDHSLSATPILKNKENMNTKDIGFISEIKIITKLLEQNKVVLRPLDDNQRYDLVIHNKENNTYFRVQCKTGRLEDGSVRFLCHNSYTPYMKQGITKSYIDQIDYFAVYCRELDECYLISINEVKNAASFSLRVLPFKSGERVNVKWAKNYIL